MLHYYVAFSASIFAIVAVAHFVRLVRGWKVQIGSRSIPLSLSWAGLIISGLLALWGFQQLS